jgi:hypothetical protein
VRQAISATAAIAALLGGCDLIPGTSANLEKRAKDRVAQLLIDPSSAQFRNVAARDEAVCGEINGKNRMGAYVGFSRFYVDVGKGFAAIDPQFDFDDLDSARDLCASLGGSSCTRAAEEEGKRLEQLAFNSFWSAKCDPVNKAASQVPFDPTQPSETDENWVEERPAANKQSASSHAEDETWFEAPDDEMIDTDGSPVSSPDAQSGSAAATDNDGAADQNGIDRAADRNDSRSE